MLFLLLASRAQRVKGDGHLEGHKGLKPKTNFEGRETSGGMCGPIVTMLYNMQIRIPLFVFSKIVAKGVDQSAIDNLCLSISLGVKCSGKTKLATQQGPKSMPEGVEEASVPIRNNATRKSEVRPKMMEEKVCGLSSRGSLMTGEKKSHLRKTTNDYPNNIVFVEHGRKTTQKIHGNGFPRTTGHRERLVQTMLVAGWLIL